MHRTRLRTVLLLVLLALAGRAGSAVAEPRLTGRVVDYAGNPVARADFDFFDPPTGLKLDPWPPANPQSDKTDAGGFFSMLVIPDTYRLRCEPPPTRTDLATVVFDVVPILADTTIDITLPRGAPLSGFARDQSGAPVFLVDLDLNEEPSGRRASASGDLTGYDGSYRVVVVPGVYTVFFTPPVTTRLAPAFVSGVTIPAEGASLDVVLAPGSWITGEVRDDAGALVADVDMDVSLAGSGAEPMWTPNDNTDFTGQINMVLPAGTFDIAFTPPHGLPLAGAVLRNVVVQSDLTLPLVTLPAGVHVDAAIVDPAGSPLAGASVVAYEALSGLPFPVASATSDASGHMPFRIPRGAFRVKVVPPAGSGLDTLDAGIVNAASDTAVTFAYPRTGVISVAVTLRVMNGPLDGTVYAWPSPRTGDPIATGRTGEDGAAQLLVAPGVYDLLVVPGPGVQPESLALAGVTLNADTTIALAFEPDAASARLRAGPVAPNPFRTSTTVSLSMPPGVPGEISLYDVLGRLVHRQALPARSVGSSAFTWTWTGRTPSGAPVPQGAYRLRVTAGGASTTATIVRLP